MATHTAGEAGGTVQPAPPPHTSDTSTPPGEDEKTSTREEKKAPWSSSHDRRATRTTSSSDAGRSSRRSRDRWWKIHLFRGIINDLRRRAPFYWSDWVDAWDYRVVPATIYMYFAK